MKVQGKISRLYQEIQRFPRMKNSVFSLDHQYTRTEVIGQGRPSLNALALILLFSWHSVQFGKCCCRM